MKFELLIIAITVFLIYNTYHNGKYTKMLMSGKKYYQMALIGFGAFSLYLIMKKNPLQGKNLLLYANNAIKFMPINKSSMDMLSPILYFTNNKSQFMDGFNSELNSDYKYTEMPERRILQSGNGATKRSVSETKKKYIASGQNWKCKECHSQLNAWFEVDHITRLEYGGGNNVENLVALCRECHGKKTAMENM